MLLYIAVGLFIAYLIVSEITFSLSRKVRLGDKLPGKRRFPFIGTLHWTFVTGTEFLHMISWLYLNNGEVSRAWLGRELVVTLFNPKDFENLLGSTAYNTKADQYKLLHPWLGTGLLTSTGEKWKVHRKIITPTFHFKILEQFIDVFNSNGEILIKKLKESKKAVDIQNFSTLYALDVVCEAALGVSVNAQLNSSSDYVKSVEDVASVIFQRTFIPWLMSDFTFRWTIRGRLHDKALDVLHSVSKKVIKERKEALKNRTVKNEKEEDIGSKKKLAFLDMLLESEGGNTLTDEEIREEVDTFMFEGHDTTSSAISFTLGMLSTHKDIQIKVRNELNEIFGDSTRHPTYRDLQEMKYLEAVIKETLRLYPSVPFIGRRLSEDFKTSSGHLIPKGTNTSLGIFQVQREEKYFPDALKFKPERFLDIESVCNRQPFAYVPFSAGSRNCIGQKFALLEIKAAVSKVVRHFNLTNAQEKEYELINQLTLKSKNGVMIKFQERNL